MKLSISLPVEDVAVIDEFVRVKGLASRSAAMQYAIRMLRFPGLEQDYEVAWAEWAESGDQQTWDGTASDGLTDAAR